MTAIPLLISPLIVRTMIHPRAQGIDPGFRRYAMGTIYLGYMLGMAVAGIHLMKGLVRVSISEQMGDMSELISFLKSRNPRIEVTRAAS